MVAVQIDKSCKAYLLLIENLAKFINAFHVLSQFAKIFSHFNGF